MTEYDPVRDLLYIGLGAADDSVSRTATLMPGMHADIGADGELIGIEVLDASDVIGELLSSWPFKISQEIAGVLELPADKAETELRKTLALACSAHDVLSSDEAAVLAGMSRQEFVRLYGQHETSEYYRLVAQ